MSTEVFNYIDSLDAAKPPTSDGLVEGDDHLRGIKLTLKNTFPNVTGAVTGTQAKFNALTANTNPRAVAVGSIQKFPKVPSSLGTGGNNSGGPFEYLEADGSVWNISDYPDLGAFYLSTFGGNGTTTFGVPNYTDTGRYLRSRTSLVTVGTYQSNQFAAHTHGPGTLAGTTSSAGSHAHGVSGSFSGSTDTQGAHSHTYTNTQNQNLGGIPGGGGNVANSGNVPGDITGSAGSHAHNVSGSISGSTDSAGAHTHTASLNSGVSASAGAGTETRPETGVVIFAIKT